MDKKELERFVLDNAVKYNGKSEIGSVVSKLLSSHPEIKENIKEIMPEINILIKEINLLSLEEQKKKLSELGEIKPREIVEKDKIPELKYSKKVIVRFAPNPNGPLSFGHCRPALWNWFIAKKYKGKYFLRFDDTDPKIKPPLKEAYNWIKEDLAWLGIKPNKIIIQSKRLKKYYKYAKKLIHMNKAYVCTCDVEKKRELLRKGLKCPCYDLYQTDRWKNMFTKYKEGEAVLRIKTDLNHPNPAIRDWAAFRIVNDNNHPLNDKAKVWPLLNFASAIDDHDFKVTHILRGIDLKVSNDRQKYIYDYFGWKYPETIYHGKLLIDGIRSTSETKKLIDSGEIDDWDDPRLGTIKSFRRRGFQPESIIRFMENSGLRKYNTNVSMESLCSYNKEEIDPKSKRYIFIKNPKKIKIKNAPELEVTIPLHPNFPKLGFRKLKTYKNFYISDEIEENKIYRFMHLFNFKNGVFVSEKTDPKLKAKPIHWLPLSSELKKTNILMNDGSSITGLCESSVENLEVGEIVQFVRNFFVKLEKKGDVYKFIYCQK
jgi:glutamyl-tRNA synthetase